METPTLLEGDVAMGALGILDFLLDLFAATPVETFSRVDILSVLNNVKNSGDLISPETVLAYEQTTEEL